MSRDLDVWFNNLSLDQLVRMFSWPAGMDANEFIDSCDEFWWDLTPGEKEEFYIHHS